ncbi:MULTISPECIES: ABC transporter permease subunit [unclassified Microbacterium]|jgi:NitT/TauT family transport system permease protein|uniref:ABC transporter permease n=1 Tax=unclassified Microbacterium TaxID=2609290 RepID=UPI0008DB2C92|nr:MULTISPECIES: ABC transporter permease subunit [unclassified Microbacterium]MAB19762.1 nitrate ABC transporter permease [Microbacterium sp.]MAM54596.1 nitrate ABC transporter permease [Microbacterium sp.]HAS30953.1 nitrate ABC transporter permease [Microbacterium sp.]HBR90072.1 nitrate ABC transporter permease [Microbacterium sp.]HBS73648.1 nitrate ABC transporter permease [Microbacterium sp.]|tara:strand:+ start:3801 stop:4619 length:819 start_codon:yes stop_codon:yes gene_type:complete
MTAADELTRAAPVARAPRERPLPPWLRIVAPVAVGVIGAVLWTLWVDVLGTAPRMLPSPVAIAVEFVTRWQIIADDMIVTATNAAVGLVAGTVLAVLLAGLATAVRPIDGMLAPLVAALAVIPIVALTPLLNTMFGASSQFGRQAVATIAAFVPVFVNVVRGLRQTRPVHRDLLRASAATGAQTFRYLTLPTAVPYLMTGLRIAASLAVIAALVAEYFGGPADGVGTSIATYAKSGRAALAWAYVVGGILIGLGFYLATTLLERFVTRGPRP